MQACDNPKAIKKTKRGLPNSEHCNAVALFAVCLAALMFGLEISSVPVVLPGLETVLHGDFTGIQWIMNAYTIACSTVLMATGTLADRFGRKRVFMITILLFGVASLLCGFSSTIAILIVGRLIQGASGGAMLICLVAVLSHQFPEGTQRARAFGIWGVIFGVGLGFGPIIGGMIVAASSWRWVFWVHVFISFLTLGLVIAGVKESRDPEARKLDIAGIVTLSLSVLGFAYFVTQGAASGFGTITSLAVITASATSFIAFMVIEKRTAQPMFDFSVFKVHDFSGALVGSMGMNFSFWPFIIYLPIYFQSVLGYSAAATALCLLSYTLPTLAFPPVGERLALRFRAGLVIPAGLFTIGMGFFLMRIGSSVAYSRGLIVLLGCFLAGTGLGLVNTPITNTTTGSVASTRAGMASGIDMSARMISLAINIALMGLLITLGTSHYLRGALPTAIGTEFVHALANRIVSGNGPTFDAPGWALIPPGTRSTIGHDALAHGFGWIMLYGGVASCASAIASFLIFSRKRFRC